jgi:hypothetical protein
MADNCAEGKQYLPRWVEGKHDLDGRVERWISVHAPAGERLSAADACRLAGLLMDAADGLDKYNPYPT